MSKVPEKLILYSNLYRDWKWELKGKFDDDSYIKKFVNDTRLLKKAWCQLNGKLTYVDDFEIVEDKIKLVDDCLPYTHSIFFQLKIKTTKKSKYGVIYDDLETIFLDTETDLSYVCREDNDIYKKQIAVFDEIFSKIEKINKSLTLIEDKAWRASSEFSDISKELVKINRTIHPDIVTIDSGCIGTGRLHFKHKRPDGKYQ